MATDIVITDTTTPEDLVKVIRGCAGYEIDGDRAAAAQYIKALVALAVIRPTEATIDGEVVRFDYSLLSDELQRARIWWRNNAGDDGTTAGNPAVRTYNMNNVRS